MSAEDFLYLSGVLAFVQCAVGREDATDKIGWIIPGDFRLGKIIPAFVGKEGIAISPKSGPPIRPPDSCTPTA